MATELDKLVVKIEADPSGLKKGMAQANKEVQASTQKIKKSLQGMGSSFAKLGGSALKFGTVLGGVFGAVAIKSVVDTGMQIETLEVRLKALFGSAEEGTKAFQEMVKFAGKVPFTLGQIQQGAGSLAVVSKDAEHLATLMEITGNVASVTGLDFRATSEQIQRSLSSGIASADLFREKGVKNMLGFGNATEVTAEQTAEALQRVFGKGGLFGNATDEMAKTLGGTLSMLGDKLFQFQTAIASTFFETLKSAFGDLNEALDDNKEQIMAFGEGIGRALADLVIAIKNNFEEIKTAFKLLGAFIAGSMIANIISKMNAVRLAVIATTVAIGLLIDALKKEVKVSAEQRKENQRAREERQKYLDQQEELKQKIQEAIKNQNDYEEALKKATEAQKEQSDIMAEDMKALEDLNVAFEMENIDKANAKTQEFIDVFKNAGKEISNTFGKAIASGESFRQSMLDIFQSVIAQVIALITQLLVIEPILESIEKSIRKVQEAREATKKTEQSNDLISQALGFFSGSGGFGGGSGGSGSIEQDLIRLAIGAFTGMSTGGTIQPNMPYIVGEQGKELFMSRSGGQMIPSNQVNSMGGGNPIVIEQNLNFATGVSQTVRAEVLNLLPAIKENTLSAVREARLRGGTFAKDFGA